MNAGQLFQAGKLDDAVRALSEELRDYPADTKRRTFLFELLCFAGAYDRASKHLDILAQAGKDAQLGALLYAGALSADRMRSEMFEQGTWPRVSGATSGVALRGTLNGRPFTFFEDGDSRLGTKLEVYAAGTYMWLPMEHIASIEMEAPKKLRDLLWIPALVRTGPAFRGTDLGEVLLPVLSPLAWKHADDAVRLGRVTIWEELADGAMAPAGAKCFLADDEEIPLLEIRSLEFEAPQPVSDQHAAAQ